MIEQILDKNNFNKSDIIRLLQTNEIESNLLFKKSATVKQKNVGNIVYYRGLVEFSNICKKDCYYCGIRHSSQTVRRYNLEDNEILEAAKVAYREGFGSFILQSGEIQNPLFTKRIEYLLKQIKKISNNQLGITISLGEQNKETYQRWFDAGAHRYLLRIEASNIDLYSQIHPNDKRHRFNNRLACLISLKEIGYQVGTGVMIGLPFQTYEHLADDLLFMKHIDIDMCGMGPYLEHEKTPLYAHQSELLSKKTRYSLSLKMIAILRLLMPDINIAASTAMQTINNYGRERAIQVGANVIMPNITPDKAREDYYLYDNKPMHTQYERKYLEDNLKNINHTIGYNKWGDSLHYKQKNAKNSLFKPRTIH